MREADYNRKLFHRAHYNILAKQFRENIQPYTSEEEFETEVVRLSMMTARVALIELAVSVAKRLVADNEDFDPVLFLNKCSPDEDKFPFGKLWETVEENGL